MDLRASETILDRIGDARASDRDSHLGSRISSQGLHRLVILPAFSRLAIDLYDLVACRNASPFGRSLGERSHYRYPTITDVDLYAQAGVVTRGLFGERLVVVARQQDRVRVLE